MQFIHSLVIEKIRRAAAAAVTSSVPAGSPAHRTTTSVPHTHRRAHSYIMLGHTPQCSGVSTQVLAECTPALAGEGRKNQSLLVPNVLERAEERRSTLRELAKVARAEGRPRPPAVRTASRKGSNDQLQLGLGCAERRRVGRDRRAARARREHRSAAGAVPLTWLCRAGQCLNDHIAGAVSTAIAATARWRASAPARLKLRT